jgi:diadenosine tetraphosphatase ApaH/serine/threonine PP2A family protein phosphatase
MKLDTILCLGDLVDFAPWPNEVIDLIRARGICTLMGNHDERIAANIEVTPIERHGPEERAARVSAIEWSRNAVTAANKAYLAGLPRDLLLSFGDRRLPRLQFAHASTRSLDEYIYQDHPEDDVQTMFQSTGTNVIVMGHTHLPYVRTFAHSNRLLINVGSVGRSKEPSRMPSFAVLSVNSDSVEAEIHRVSYDVRRTTSKIRTSPIPDFYADFLENTGDDEHTEKRGELPNCGRPQSRL